MKRRNWALITGAIRSDFYLRVIIAKICSLRDKGLIEGIVLSTWVNEIDVYPGLRDELTRCGIVLVETPYIDEKAEAKFNQTSYVRQNVTINNGISVIPDDSFVLKLRTDFLVGINAFLNYIFGDNFNDSVKSYGSFPTFYKYKMTLESYHPGHLMFCNDRFFYAYKQDLKKICTPYITKKFALHDRYVENDLLLTFAFQSIPLLREIWNIIDVNFFNCLLSYSFSQDDEKLKLPIIVYRIYALILVFVYTHISLSCNQMQITHQEPIKLIALFTDKLNSELDIEKLVTCGGVKPTNASKLFVEELRKIALNLPETQTYTYEEYKELCDFCKNELKNPSLVDPYPFALNQYQINTQQSIDTLFEQYEDKTTITHILSKLDSFDSVLSLVSEQQIDYKSQLGINILKAVVFDQIQRNSFYYKILYTYVQTVSNDISLFDHYTWNQAKRNLCFAFAQAKLYGYVLASTYIFLKISMSLSNNDDSMVMLYYDTLRLFEVRIYGKILKISFEKNLMQHDYIMAKMILFLHENAANNAMSENEIETIRALLLIAPEKCPFSRVVIDKIQKNNLTEIYSNIKSLYGDSECNIDNYINYERVINVKKLLMSEKFELEKFLTLLGGMEKIKNFETKNSEYVLKILLSNDVDSPELIETLFNNADMKDSILYKAYHCDAQQTFYDSNDICLSNSDYLVLCKILKNNDSIAKYTTFLENAATTIMQKAILSIFFRLVDDPNIRFFSMKNGLEMWFSYVPFCESQWNKLLVIPRNENGQIWPWSEFANSSSYAAYLKIADSAVFISIEFCSEPGPVKNNLFDNAKLTNVDNFDVNSKIIRLKVTKFPFENDEELEKAVNLALDEFSRIGNILSNVNFEFEE